MPENCLKGGSFNAHTRTHTQKTNQFQTRNVTEVNENNKNYLNTGLNIR